MLLLERVVIGSRRTEVPAHRPVVVSAVDTSFRKYGIFLPGLIRIVVQVRVHALYGRVRHRTVGLGLI